MDPGFGLLGRTVVRVEGVSVAGWGRPRERALLTALLLQPGKALSLQVLADWIWPDQEQIPQHLAPTIQTYVHRVRAVLKTADVPAILAPEAGKYRLQVDRSEIDFFVFRELIMHARSAERDGRYQDAVEAAASALQLWRGDPLADLTSERAANWRQRVVLDEWIPANTLYVKLLRGLSRPEAALAHVDDVQAEHGEHHLGLIEQRLAVLSDLGRYTDATSYYMKARRDFLAEGDDQSADLLRRAHDNLRDGGRPVAPRQAEASVPRMLPHDTPDFVGRAEALRTLDATAAVGDATVIAMDGMPGVGKTTLATHWARRVRDQFPDGDLYVDLNGHGAGTPVEPAAVVDRLLEQLGITVDKESDARARALRLTSALAGRRMIVVLDSAHNSDHVMPLLPTLSSCLVVVTSRYRLGSLSAWRGARHVHVTPLTEAESTRLLTARLALRGGPAGAADVAELVALCGGLPLTINLVAHHLAGHPSTQLSTAITLLRRRGILNIGEVGAAMATLGSAFTMSYRTLVPRARRMLGMLGLHPGPEIDLATAAALAGLDEQAAITDLDVLFASHFVERADQLDRFRLHDLVREFAEAQALAEQSAEERRAAQERLLSYLLATAMNALCASAPAAGAPPNRPVSAGVQPKQFENGVEAEAWCLRESAQLDAAVAAAARHGHHDFAWRLPHAIVPIYDRHGRYQASRTNMSIAVAAAKAAGNAEAEASSLSDLGMINLLLGDYPAARECLRRAWQMVGDEDNDLGQSAILHNLARLDVLEGDLLGGIDRYRRTLDICTRAGIAKAQCWTLIRLGDALRQATRYDEATLHLHQAVWLSGHIGDEPAHAHALAALGNLLAERGGDHASAEAYFGEALDLATRIKELTIAGRACTLLAESCLGRGAVKHALGYARRAVDLHLRTSNVNEEARALEVLGEAHFELGNLAAAEEGWQRALGLFTKLDAADRTRLQDRLAELPPAGANIPGARTTSPAIGRLPSRRNPTA